MNRAFTVIVLSLCVPGWGIEFLSSDNRATHGPEILNRSVGARNIALGNAGVPMANDASAVFWNPAVMNFVPRTEFFLSHESGFYNERIDSLAVIKPVWWRGARQTLGAGFNLLSQPPFEVVENTEPVGQANPYEFVGSLSYAHRWGRGTMGITGKYIRQQLLSTHAQAYALDVGLSAQKNRWRAGTVIANVGTPLKGPGQSVPLPFVFKMGGAVNLLSSSQKGLWLAGQADAPVDDALVVHGGLESVWSFGPGWKTNLLVGYQENGVGAGPSAGAGLERHDWSLHYAIHFDDELGDSFRLDLRWRFGKPLSQERERQEGLARAKREIDAGQLIQAQTTVGALLKLAPRDGDVTALAKIVNRRFSESVDPQTLFLQAYQSARTGDFESAVSYLEKLLIVSPDHADGKKLMASCRPKADAERARRLQEQMARAMAKEYADILKQAKNAESAGRWEDAFTHWNRLKSITPSAKDPDAGIARCRAEFLNQSQKAEMAGDYGKAIAALKRARMAGESPAAVGARIERLENRREQEERNASIKNLDQNRRKADELYTRGTEAYSAGEWETARRFFQNGLDLDPTHRALRRAWERINAEHPVP